MRYRFHLEERGFAPGTINVRLADERRLAYEAADGGLLSPELAAGVHRVSGVRKLGSRLGNWLTAGEASPLWQSPDGRTVTGKRNRAILAILLGCGLPRHELAELALESLQRREERWAIVELVGKGKTHTNHSPELGEGDAGRVANGNRHRKRPVISMCL